MDFRQEWPTFSSHFLKEKEHALENKYRKQKDFVPTLLLPHTYAIKNMFTIPISDSPPPARPPCHLSAKKQNIVCKNIYQGVFARGPAQGPRGAPAGLLACLANLFINIALLFSYQHCSDFAFSLSTLL